MPITKLKFANIGPFDEIEFEFDEQVNVFVGPNNCGKSTVLMVLGDIVVGLGIPQKLFRVEHPRFEAHYIAGQSKKSFQGILPIGTDKYWFHWVARESVKPYVDMVESIGYATFIPALRWNTDFRAKTPTIKRNRQGEKFTLTESQKEIPKQEKTVEITTEDKDLPPAIAKRVALTDLFDLNPSLIRDEEAVQIIVDLDYKAYRESNPAIRAPIHWAAKIASEITEGFVSAFSKIGEDERGLFPEFKTKDGSLPLNVLSQGTQSIIQWLTHLIVGYAEYYNYPKDLTEKPGILIIDEIDAHLHPSWQRRIIPALTKAFPRLQIFCSTHSPLMLAGLKEGQIHLLRRDDKGKVTVTRNETDVKGWSADEILRTFLDVRNPTDLETTRHIERLQELRRKTKLTPSETEELEDLRHTINRDLISGPIAAQLEQFRDTINSLQVTKNTRTKKKQPDRQRRSRKA